MSLHARVTHLLVAALLLVGNGAPLSALAAPTGRSASIAEQAPSPASVAARPLRSVSTSSALVPSPSTGPWGWGLNRAGQLGDGNTTSPVTTPVAVLGPGGTGTLTNITAVSGGQSHTLALRNDGTVWAWGSNSNGQLGDGTTTSRLSPVQVVGPGGSGFLTGIVAVAAPAGGGYSLALGSDGTVWGWGYNANGQLGDGTTTFRHTPVHVVGPGGTGILTNVVAIAAGANAGYAVKGDGTVWSWGYNNEGELGNGTTGNGSLTPTQVVGIGGQGFFSGAVAVTAGNVTAFALKADGTAYGWGLGTHGRLGAGSNPNLHYANPAPLPVASPSGTGALTGIVAISAGDAHAVALTADGSVYAWGENLYGEVGDGKGAIFDAFSPVQIENGGFISVAAGGNHSLAVDASGNVWAWGQGGNGELGNGGTANSNVPIELSTPSGMTTVAAGYNTSFAFAAAPPLVYNPLSALARFFFPVGYTPDPVNTASGDGVHTQTDISIPGRGIPLQFTRYYHSGSTQARSLGVGWTHTYDMYLSISPAEVTVFYPDGHAAQFPLSNGVFVAPPGITDTLVQNADGTYTLTTAHQVRYIFSASGALTSIADRDNNTTTLAYTNGLLTSVTDPGGRSLTFTYDGSNRIVQITDPLPAPNTRTVQFGYDANGDLTTVTDVKGGVTTYAYSTHRMTSLTDANNHLAVQNVYDSNGRVAEQHNALGGVTCTYYGRGPTYTSTACPGVTPAPTGNQTIVVDPRGNKTTYTTDARGRTVAVQDALGNVTRYAYDGNDNTVCVTDPRGNKTGYAYDGKGNLTQTIDALNTDANCNLKSGGVAATFTYTPLNDIAQATDLLGRQTVYTYDASGNLIQVAHKDAGGTTVSMTCFTRNGAGEITAKIESTTLTDCTGNTTTYTYDTYGNQTSLTDPRFVGQPNPPQQIFTYDLAGRMLTATNELGHTTTYTYDPQNNILTITDNLNHTTTRTYDAKGNLTSVTDANNHTTRYAYDDGDHLTQVTDPLNQTTHYGYDLNGNRTSVTDAQNHTTSYAYDALNRLQTETDPLNRQTTYQYDAASNLSQRTDARGLVTTYSYDAENRLVQVQHWNGSTPLDSVSYTYDAVGNRLTLQDPTGTTSYVYDALNRPTSITFPGSKVVGYQYDAVGNRTQITYPDSKQVTYAYDAANDLQTVTDWLNKQTTYTYDNAAKLTQIQLPNNVTTTYTYDTADRLTQIVHRAGSTELSSYTYTLDPVGNRTQVVDPSGTISYQYDALDRLTQVTYPGSNVTSYAYDPVGNRQTMTVNGTPTSYSYDNADELTQVGSTAYGYDANGNQTSRGSDTFTYDPENRLTQSVIGGQTSSSVYNGDGLRVSHTVGATTTSYVWDVADGLPEVLQDGTNTYVYGLGLISSTDSSGTQTYFLHDGLGSTVALTDGSGNVTATYAYDAFGAVRSQTGSASTPWQFTGQQLDADSSLYFLRARYYDPSTGRFLGRDPLSASLNPYSYADNNPVNATDPSGMVATPPGDADLGYPVISDFGGSAASKEGGQMPSYADCQNQTNPLWLFCPSALIRLANGAIIDLPPWERSLLDGLAGLDSGGDAAYATGDSDGRSQREVVDPRKFKSFEEARNAALDWLGEIDEATRKPYRGNLGPGEGKIVGFETTVNGVWKRLRIDFDETKKAHIHVETKGSNRVFKWPGTLKDFLSQLEVLQRDPVQ